MAGERRKRHRSPIMLMTHCAKPSDTVNAYEYFSCFIKDVSPVGACLVSVTKVHKGQLLALIIEMQHCMASVLLHVRVAWVHEASFGSDHLYTAGLRFFDMCKASQYPNLVDFSKVENLLMRHASSFRNVPWLSIRESRCISTNVSYGQ